MRSHFVFKDKKRIYIFWHKTFVPYLAPSAIAFVYPSAVARRPSVSVDFGYCVLKIYADYFPRLASFAFIAS